MAEAGVTRWTAAALVSVLLVLMVFAAGCGSDTIVGGAEPIDVATPTPATEPESTEGPATATPTESPASEQPDSTPTTVPASTSVAEPTPTTPATSGDSGTSAPACDDVPQFYAADSVSVACAGGYAMSPELFASNVGWHLFEAQAGEWIEIDYALTCCGTDGETSFAGLAARNGVDTATVEALCAAANVGECVVVGEGESTFSGDWLRVNGLGAHDFGAAETAVLASATAVFGSPIDVFEASECGAGPMTIVSYDEFTIQFQDDALIGWFYTASNPAMTTPSGVAPGIDEPTLEQAYPGVQIEETTLGREFFYDVPAGFMAGFIEDGTVTSLYAGTNCFFR